jgi:hypothetical protein
MVRNVARMGPAEVYTGVVKTKEGKKSLGRNRRRWENNIKMDLQDVGYQGMDWIDLSQDRAGGGHL